MSLATAPGAIPEEEEHQKESFADTPINDAEEDASPESNELDQEDTASLTSENNPESYPDSPPSSCESDDGGHCPSSSSYLVNERISCTNNPSSKVTALLQSRPLWSRFDAIGTEMIVTRRGRRMFPPIKVELYDLKPDVYYVLLMDMAPVDNYRYKYQNSSWVKCFEEECSPTRLYVHPDSPALGSHWSNMTISFYKLKLTNNQLDKQGHVIVNSMHRYHPRLHVAEASDIHNLNWDKINTFVFPGTQFTTVTAYQNDKITQLKIENNPFAKGFRTPFARCRAHRCNQQIVVIRPGSESSSEGLRSPSSGTLMSPHIILPLATDDKHEQIYTRVGYKRHFDTLTSEHPAKQICLSVAQHSNNPTVVKMETHPQIITSPATIGTQESQSSPPIYIIYNPTVIQQQQQQQQLGVQQVHKNGRINGSTPVRICSNGQILNGHAILQADGSVLPLNGIIQPTSPKLKKVNGLNSASRHGNGIQSVQPTLIQTSNGAIIQASPMVLPQQAIINGGGIFPFAGDQLTAVSASSPVIIRRAPPRSEAVIHSNKPPSSSYIDISALTRKHRHLSSSQSATPSPPPLVQVKPEKQDSPTSPSPPTQTLSIASLHPSFNGLTTSAAAGPGLFLPAGSINGGQNLILLASNSTSAKAGNTILVPVQQQPPRGTTHTGALQTAVAVSSSGQTVIPVAYDQQVLMPFYRSPISTANTLQPIQIITPIQANN